MRSLQNPGVHPLHGHHIMIQCLYLTAAIMGESMNDSEHINALALDILKLSRNTLLVNLRFLDRALSMFDYVSCPDGSIPRTGVPLGGGLATDGKRIYYAPKWVLLRYRKEKEAIARDYLHMVFHCIFRHFIKQGMDGRYWNLSCDIAAEHMIDGIYHRSVRFSRSLLRRETYRKLEAEKKVLNAERIYRILTAWELEEKELLKLEQEFYQDDHRYWENQKPDQKPSPQMNQKWQEINEEMETDLETFSKEASRQTGDFLDQVKIENRKRQDYGEFLRKFAVFREEIGVDPDTFDYTFYSYGLQMYGNMPLIEPQETKEVKKVAEFVIVIDTSMSCSRNLVRKFLEETYGILCEEDSFFKKTNIHILQCDETVQSDQKITSKEELKEYMEHLKLYGEGGTDFRPAFAYVDQMLENHEFEELKGLLYFTDGYGIYPGKMPAYKTAFVFMQEDYRDVDVPAWALKLIIEESEMGGDTWI